MYIEQPRNKGRKMVVGNLRQDPHTGRLAIFAGYCPTCQDKVFLEKQNLRGFFTTYNRDKGSITVRMLQRLLNRLQA